MYSKRSWIQMKEVLPLKISLQRTVPLCLFPLSIVRFWFVSFFLFCFFVFIKRYLASSSTQWQGNVGAQFASS